MSKYFVSYMTRERIKFVFLSDKKKFVYSVRLPSLIVY